jgi:excinuclease UvrABC ATPase subunit
MDEDKATPQDVLIVIMGITGSGKSTFISHCTDSEVGIGVGLKSRKL